MSARPDRGPNTLEQFIAGAGGARTLARLDNVARLSWHAWSEGHLTDDAAQAVAEAVEAHRARSKEAPAPSPAAVPREGLRRRRLFLRLLGDARFARHADALNEAVD